MRLLALLFALFALFALSSAWPWPPSFQLHNALLRRDSGGGGGNQTSTASPGSTASSGAATATSGASKGSGSASATAAPTGKDSGNSTAHGNGTASASASAAATTADPRDPPGGIAMLTPASTSTTYYKIGNDVTLVWNYTSLEVTPSAINVVASNTNGVWTLTTNASVHTTNSVVWETKNDEGGANPLLTDKYTLVVYDAAESPTSVPKPGHLSSFVNFQFGMYLPRPYTPLAEFVCATCNGAMSQAERHTLGFIFAMGAITVLSFTWFTNGFLGAVP